MREAIEARDGKIALLEEKLEISREDSKDSKLEKAYKQQGKKHK